MLKYGLRAGSVLGLKGTDPIVAAHVLQGVLTLWNIIICTWLHCSGAGVGVGVGVGTTEGTTGVGVDVVVVAEPFGITDAVPHTTNSFC
jgi:hypothetical protein